MSEQKIYDVVIIGAGISGAIAAFKLAQAGKSVLVLDGGSEVAQERNDYMEKFYLSMAKTPESPYPDDPDNPRPLVLAIADWKAKDPTKGYFIQNGPLPFSSTYERVAGGTTWHWMGTSLRHLPNDFQTNTKYGHGVDWPYGYDELQPWYGRAEHEIGVSADVAPQEYHGLTFSDPDNPSQPYEYPMPGIPQSYLDIQLAKALGSFPFDGQDIFVSPTPQARNSIPFDERRVCAGNTNCIPICPIQAKYDATVHIAKAQNMGVDIMYKTIAEKLLVDQTSGQISGVTYKQYDDPSGGVSAEGKITGAKLYIMAAHAIETPKILLNSATNELPHGVANSSLQVGKNLMDHPTQLSWAFMPTPLYPYRGPLSTSGIESLRDGDFRTEHAPFRMEIGNEGWNWATNDPWNSVNEFVGGKQFGTALKTSVNHRLTGQFRFGSLVEQMPLSTNCIVPSKTVFDHLGIPVPEINYDLDDYTRAGYAAARAASAAFFEKAGATDMTAPVDPKGASSFDFDGTTYQLNGAGHVMGTLRMGTDKASCVVDENQRSHDHTNLFMVGSGVFPSVGTANPTLTIVATTLKTVDFIIKNVKM